MKPAVVKQWVYKGKFALRRLDFPGIQCGLSFYGVKRGNYELIRPATKEKKQPGTRRYSELGFLMSRQIAAMENERLLKWSVPL